MPKYSVFISIFSAVDTAEVLQIQCKSFHENQRFTLMSIQIAAFFSSVLPALFKAQNLRELPALKQVKEQLVVAQHLSG